MDKKTAEKFMRELISRAPSYGFEDCAAFYDEDESMEVQVLNGEVSNYERSSNIELRFKGKKNGQMSGSVTSEFTEESMTFLLENTSANCDILNDEDEDFIYCDPEHPTLTYSQTTDAYSKNTYERFSEIALGLEKDILNLDERIKSVDYLSVDCSYEASLIINSKGLYLYCDEDDCSVYAGARAVSGDVTKTCGNFWYGKDIDLFNKDLFLSKLKKDLLGKFGASPVDSGSYDIIIGNEALISLFASFIGNFSAYAMQKGISLLNGKEGSKIASELLSLKEVPMSSKAITKCPFDNEGVLTTEKYLIKNGIMETALHNLKTANKAGIKSTGNGFGGISTTNLILEPGTYSFDELCKNVSNGVYITELNGLHAGVNAISGDFSLFCEGYLIENGEIVRPVEQITVSDNFYTLINKVKAIGNDTFNYPIGVGEFIFPSVAFSNVSISGDTSDIIE